MKTLLAKKYALPTQVINALIDFFIGFVDERGLEEYEEDDMDSDEDDDGESAAYGGTGDQGGK